MCIDSYLSKSNVGKYKDKEDTVPILKSRDTVIQLIY